MSASPTASVSLRRWAAAGAAALAMAGCAGVPDSGPVRVGDPVAAAGGGLADATVREVPAGPAPGAGPVDVVSGFLRALVDSDGGYGVARLYLSPGAAWSTGSAITIYSDPTQVVRTGRASVVMHADRAGVVGPHGDYQVERGRVTRHFQLVRRDGEWRIAKLDAGVLISSDDVGRVLQPAVLYFLTPAGDRVVPEPVLEPPQEPGLATTLMRALLAGPGPLLAPGVRTAVPRGTTLIGNVPISADGVAEVDLSAGARQITPPQLERLSAQVVWTLRQLSSVTAVRLFANGTPLEATGVPLQQSVHLWRQYDPAAPPSSPGAWLIRDGQVVGLGADPAPAARGRNVVAATRSGDGSLVAVVRRRGGEDELLVGPASGPLRRRLRDPVIAAPSFGADGTVLTATSSGAVYVIGPDGSVHRATPSGPLTRDPVLALDTSRDGTRIAAVLETRKGRELCVATVVRTGHEFALHEPRVVLPPSSNVAGVSWADATAIVATVAAGAGRRGVVEVGSDGYRVQELTGPGLPADVDEVGAAPDQRILAAGSGGTWQLVGRRWRHVSGGSAPSYAGG